MQRTTQSILAMMAKSRAFRIALAKISHFWFFHLYFADYIKFKTADFQREIFRITEDETSGLAVVMAFRGSGKSTIVSLSYPLWAILGRQGKRFVVILSQTQRQAKQLLSHIKAALERNPLLRADLGPFKEETDEWGGYSLVIPRYNARIMAASSEQSIRGMRHLQFRPDVIVADDVEDLFSTRTQEGRDKTYAWFKGDVLPAGASETKVIVVGNLLHEDSLLRRLQGEIDSGAMKGIYRMFPVLNEKGEALWPGKFPAKETINAERLKYADEHMWQREFCLTIIPEEDQVIKREWIAYYDDFPESHLCKWTKIGIDLAISEKDHADYTAMVTGSLFGSGKDAKLYIHPHPVNQRMDFPASIEKAKLLADTKRDGRISEFLVEEVAYQAAFTQALRIHHYPARGVQVGRFDKRSRLASVSQFIKEGRILFPKKGCEHLITQLVHFGVEKHDDLMDALVILAMHFVDRVLHPGARPGPKIDLL